MNLLAVFGWIYLSLQKTEQTVTAKTAMLLQF